MIHKHIIFVSLCVLHGSMFASDTSAQPISPTEVCHLLNATVQEYTGTHHTGFTTPNCSVTHSKMLLKLRNGFPDDLYTPQGWYKPDWSTMVAEYKADNTYEKNKQRFVPNSKEARAHLIRESNITHKTEVYPLIRVYRHVPDLFLKFSLSRTDLLNKLHELFEMRIYPCETHEPFDVSLYEIVAIKSSKT